MPAVEKYIFDKLKQISRNIIINRKISCIHNSHIHSGLNGMIKESRMHGFAQSIVTTEGER